MNKPKIKKIYPERIRRIVCLGGGNGMPGAVLPGLKKYPVSISAISATLDNGGSAGKLRETFGTDISFGDIRRAVLALSDADENTKNYWKKRDWSGHVMANVFCTAATLTTGSKEEAIDQFKRRLQVSEKYDILPVTLDNANICAVLENNEVIIGETNIDVPKHNTNLAIKEVYLEPRAKAHPKALEAIKEADLITLGPGDLYSSLAHILLVDGVAEALKKSKAKKVFICNLMQKNGETNNYNVSDFVSKVERFLGKPLNYVIYNNVWPSPQKISAYKKEHPELLNLVRNQSADARFIGADLLRADAVAHDSDKVAKVLMDLVAVN
jgi:uncharacterized cofD-like protein